MRNPTTSRTNSISGPGDHIIRFGSDNPRPGDNRLKYPSYNFDSAAGINYTVDVTKPKGSKITISSMASGEPFDMKRRYRVAINSYRGNGGGDLLTKGAGIPHDSLTSRIVSATDKDLRFYLMKAIEEKGVIEPTVTPNGASFPKRLQSLPSAPTHSFSSQVPPLTRNDPDGQDTHPSRHLAHGAPARPPYRPEVPSER